MPSIDAEARGRALILTTHIKDEFPLWQERTVILPGWEQEARQSWNRPWKQSYWKDAYFAWKLFRTSPQHDVVVTGGERLELLFALFQRVARRRRVPHLLLQSLGRWNLPSQPLRRALRRFLLRRVAEAASRIVVFSQRQVELYARAYRLSPDKFVCVPYHTTLYRDQCPVSDGDYVFAGGDGNRDYATLIEAARGLPHKVLIACRFRYHFRGIHIPANVRILSPVDDEYIAMMAGARVVVVPLQGGLLHPGGEQTYLNAMALGKPVVVTDDCGASEYISHGKTGMVVKPSDWRALREALRVLFEDRGLARRIGEAARRVALGYTPERFYARILALAEKCAGERRGG